jgi:diguanylate cyclase (GGDEF)-like protein
VRNGIPRDLNRVALIFALAMAIILAAYGALRDEYQRTVFLDVVPPIVEVLAGGFLLFVSGRVEHRSKRLSGAWAAIGLAVLIYGAGDIAWAYLELGLKQPPFPSIADVFYLLYYPVFLVGVIRLIYGPISGRAQLRLGLDLGTIMVAAYLVFWNLLIGPVIQSGGGESLQDRLILSAYPVGDLVLFGALLLIIYHQSDQQDITSTVVLAAGIVAMIVTDSIYGYQTVAGTYSSGQLLDFGWTATHLLVGLAGLPQLSALLATGTSEETRIKEMLLRGFRTVQVYLPYAAVILAYVLVLRAGVTPLPMSPLLLAVGLGVIMGLVLIRQVLTLVENLQLTDQVMSKAAELEGANRDLAAEITERKRIEQKLSYDALHDGMTGLPNRALFLDRLGQAIEYSQRRREFSFAVLFIDMDHFKVVNDSLGHLIGDQLLAAIGARLRETLRSGDTLARFGGDEFAILMDTMQQDDAANRLAERIQMALQRPFKLDGHELHASASIGIVTDVANYRHAEELLRDADLAMYEAKALGKARSESFDVELRNQALLRMEMEDELRKGLDSGEITVHYQPIVSLDTYRIAGVEALVRWKHPHRGLLPPKDFLAMAEETGLILPVGDQVLEEACRAMQALHQRYPGLQHISVDVNISNKQFTQPKLTEKVAQVLRLTGLEPQSLRLEVTERVLIGNMRMANRVFGELHEMGVQLDIDDFGTGYSALAYLHNFPIHALKIDRAFIEGMRKDRKGLGLVRAIVSMAHELGMETVAEGIETEEQLNELKALLCHYGQGLLLSPPLELEEVRQLFDRVQGGEPLWWARHEDRAEGSDSLLPAT